MVFVHARNATVKTALALRELAKQNGDMLDFQCEQDNFKYGNVLKRVCFHFLLFLDNIINFLTFLCVFCNKIFCCHFYNL